MLGLSLHTDFDYRLLRLRNKDIGLTAGFTVQLTTLSAPSQLTQALVNPVALICPKIYSVLLLGVKRSITVRYIHLSIKLIHVSTMPTVLSSDFKSIFLKTVYFCKQAVHILTFSVVG